MGSFRIQDGAGAKRVEVVLYRVTGALCDWDPEVSLKPGNAEERVDARAGDIKPAPWDCPSPGAADYDGGPNYAESHDGAQPSGHPENRNWLLRLFVPAGWWARLW